MSESSEYSISLDADHALVLFELMIRLQSGTDLLLGEREVLNHLVCALERQLVEPFRSDFGELVAQARAKLATSQSD